MVTINFPTVGCNMVHDIYYNYISTVQLLGGTPSNCVMYPCDLHVSGDTLVIPFEDAFTDQTQRNFGRNSSKIPHHAKP
jgi:hypothetical protein